MRAGWDRLLTGVAISLACGVAAYGLYLLVVGPVLVMAVPGGAASEFREPNVAGALPLAGAVLTLIGIRSPRRGLAVVGAVLVLALGLVFIFSMGGVLIPLGFALLVVVAIRAFVSRIGGSVRST